MILWKIFSETNIVQNRPLELLFIPKNKRKRKKKEKNYKFIFLNKSAKFQFYLSRFESLREWKSKLNESRDPFLLCQHEILEFSIEINFLAKAFSPMKDFSLSSLIRHSQNSFENKTKKIISSSFIVILEFTGKCILKKKILKYDMGKYFWIGGHLAQISNF